MRRMALVMLMALDVTKPADVQKVLGDVMEDYGRIDKHQVIP